MSRLCHAYVVNYIAEWLKDGCADQTAMHRPQPNALATADLSEPNDIDDVFAKCDEDGPLGQLKNGWGLIWCRLDLFQQQIKSDGKAVAHFTRVWDNIAASLRQHIKDCTAMVDFEQKVSEQDVEIANLQHEVQRLSDPLEASQARVARLEHINVFSEQASTQIDLDSQLIEEIASEIESTRASMA